MYLKSISILLSNVKLTAKFVEELRIKYPEVIKKRCSKYVDRYYEVVSSSPASDKKFVANCLKFRSPWLISGRMSTSGIEGHGFFNPGCISVLFYTIICKTLITIMSLHIQ